MEKLAEIATYHATSSSICILYACVSASLIVYCSVQHAFFAVQVFNPFAYSYLRSQLPRCYQLHEREKRRAYDVHVRELAFHHWCLQLLMAWGPLLQLFLGSLLQCWLRSTALITASAYSACIADFTFHCWDRLWCVSGVIALLILYQL